MIERLIIHMKLANNLKIYRQKKHYTQTKLANKLHVSRKTISNWENGRSQPSYQMLDKLSKIYGVSTSNLLSDKSNKISKAIFISYFLNVILLISYYPTTVYDLRIFNFTFLFLSLNLIFLIINYKRWCYVITNKLSLCFILFVSLIDLILNSWFYLAHSFGARGITYMAMSYQVLTTAGAIFIIMLLTISFFIALLLSKYIKLAFIKLK